MELLIDLRADCPIYEQIYEFIKNEIKNGQILPDTKLPSTRRLSQSLKISRTTVVNAYEQLLAEGYLRSRGGSGYIVNKLDDMDILKRVSGTKERSHSILSVCKTDSMEDDNLIDFSPTKIDSKSFPYASWRSIARKVFSGSDVFTAGDNQGEYGLRAQIADYLHTARRVECTPQNIIIGAGSEYLILLLGLLLGRKRIALENPSYIKARQIFDSMEWDIISVDMDDEGMDIDKLERVKADICYLMPANQYPTGVIMPIKRRRELIAWSYEKSGRYIIEDDYDS
ncbi:MAG: PLP-dependent aminotransferase family protein, partial [Lachnoanaerobaculum sp.]|nr:PLP-dependent aminotransferase family protein [Lachnoanaerobaculum sp.]